MNDCHPTDEVRAFLIRAQPRSPPKRRLQVPSPGCAGLWRPVWLIEPLPIASTG